MGSRWPGATLRREIHAAQKALKARGGSYGAMQPMLLCTPGPDCTLENLRLDTLQRDIVSKCRRAPAF